MATRSVVTTDTLETFRTTFNSLGTDVGDLTDLSTSNKSSVVAAINEAIGGVNNFTIRDSSSTTQTIIGGDTLNFVGSGGITATVSATDTLTIAADSSIVTLSGLQVLTNKTLTSAVLNTGVSGTAILDEDTLSSNSDTQLATQQSIKAYVDNQISGLSSTLTIRDDSSTTDNVTIGTDTLSFAGGAGITSVVTDNTVTFNIDSTVATLTGSQVLTNKTINSSSNTLTISGSEATLSNIGNASLTNSSFTLNGVTINLGDTTSIVAGTDWQTGVVADGSTVTAAAAGEGYFIDTTSFAHTINLPGSPALGDEVTIVDASGTADTNNITVGRNGNNIQGSAADLTVSSERAAFTLVYYNATQGWLLK